MKLLHNVPQEVLAVIFDNDGTLNDSPPNMAEGRANEIAAIADRLGWGPGDHAGRIQQRRLALGSDSQLSTLTAAVLDFGLEVQWWNSIRNDCYFPERHLEPNPGLVRAVADLGVQHQIAVASNNPFDLTTRALKQSGFEDLLPGMPVFGPEQTGCSKADVAYFHRVADRLGVPAQNCVFVGDREKADGVAAEAGMGTVIVDGPEEAIAVCHALATATGSFDPVAAVREHLQSTGPALIGVTGYAGAGKTYTVEQALAACRAAGIEMHVLGLDAFFILSRADRKQWLAEVAGRDETEYARRANQMSWWNFDLAIESLGRLRAGQGLHLEGVYDRTNDGELTGTIDIPTSCDAVFVEGVAIAHLHAHLHALWMLHSEDAIRRGRIATRDQKPTAEADARWELTQSFDTRYFGLYGDFPTVHLGGSLPYPRLLLARNPLASVPAAA